MNLLDITHADKNIGSVVAEVLLPLPLGTALSYAVPISLEDRISEGSLSWFHWEDAGVCRACAGLSGVEKNTKHEIKPIKQIIYPGQWSTSSQRTLALDGSLLHG